MSASQGTLRISVADTGPGLSVAEQEQLFQPFMQGEAGRASANAGTGLGLVLARRMAQALGGDIEIQQSAIGVGTTFVISVADSEPTAVAVDVPRELLASYSGQPLTGLKILAVDDACDNRTLLQHLLSSQGALVEVASSGRAALEKVERLVYDLIFMDIQMPSMDGYTTVAHLRSRGYVRPVVALTAHAMVGERERYRAAGFDGYLTKPLSSGDLIGTVLQLCGPEGH